MCERVKHPNLIAAVHGLLQWLNNWQSRALVVSVSVHNEYRERNAQGHRLQFCERFSFVLRHAHCRAHGIANPLPFHLCCAHRVDEPIEHRNALQHAHSVRNGHSGRRRRHGDRIGFSGAVELEHALGNRHWERLAKRLCHGHLNHCGHPNREQHGGGHCHSLRERDGERLAHAVFGALRLAFCLAVCTRHANRVVYHLAHCRHVSFSHRDWQRRRFCEWLLVHGAHAFLPENHEPHGLAWANRVAARLSLRIPLGHCKGECDGEWGVGEHVRVQNRDSNRLCPLTFLGGKRQRGRHALAVFNPVFICGRLLFSAPICHQQCAFPLANGNAHGDAFSRSLCLRRCRFGIGSPIALRVAHGHDHRVSRVKDAHPLGAIFL